MPGKTEERTRLAAASPEIGYGAKRERLDGKAGGRQTCGQNFLATPVVRTDRWPSNEGFGQVERLRHRLLLYLGHNRAGADSVTGARGVALYKRIDAGGQASTRNLGLSGQSAGAI